MTKSEETCLDPHNSNIRNFNVKLIYPLTTYIILQYKQKHV